MLVFIVPTINMPWNKSKFELEIFCLTISLFIVIFGLFSTNFIGIEVAPQREVRNVSWSCDNECKKFRELMRSWPEDKSKAAIVVLTQTKQLKTLQFMLQNLDIYFLNKFQYPIIVFHEEEYRPFIDEVRTFSNASTFFQEMSFSIPEFISLSRVPVSVCDKFVGYRHMCRFHASLLYQQPVVEDLDFVFRLDDDSNITHPVEYDLVKYMRDKGLWYGYMFHAWDDTECVKGLWDATTIYIQEQGIKPTFFKEWPEPRIFYNNFEISKVAFWRSKEYRKYMKYIDRLGGIYYYRWGDAPIKSLALSLFMPKKKVHHFQDIGYTHQHLTNEPS